MANKPWLKNNDTKEIFPMGVKVTIKKLSFGQSRQVIKESSKINMITKQAEIDHSLIGSLRALYSIIDWEVTDENNEKFPITLETFDNSLDESFVGELIQDVQKAFEENEVTEEGKKD